MRQVALCLICGKSDFRHLVRFKEDCYFQQIPCLEGQSLHYRVCAECGFVFQSPTLEDHELEELYAMHYRPEPPPADYLKDQDALVKAFFPWLERQINHSARNRRVLEIGCATGRWLATFREHGWETVGVDANAHWTEWGRSNYGLDLRDGFYGPQTFPGERFSLILFSHIIEHLPDPLPTLSAIRENLEEDGYLFVGTPDVLRPRAEATYPVLMAGPHVNLYSPRTLRALLRKAGFEVVRLDHWNPRGIRALARRAPTRPAQGTDQYDHWKVIKMLYTGLFHRTTPEILARNLRALIPRYEPLIGKITQKDLLQNYRLIWNQGRLLNVEFGRGGSGKHGLLLDPGSNRERDEDAILALDGPAGEGLIVQVGLGLGEKACGILSLLAERDRRLLICEPDPAIVRAAFMSRDLTQLLASERVLLAVGPQIALRGKVSEWLLGAGGIAVTTDPTPHDHWHGRYDRIVEYFKSGRWRSARLKALEFKPAA